MLFEIILIAFSVIVLGVLIAYLIKAAYSLAPWIPSKASMVSQAFEYIRPPRGTSFIDLGCGDGRIVALAYKRYGLEATGIEISPIPYMLARVRSFALHSSKAAIIYGDLFKHPLHTYRIIFIYGLPKALNEKLVPKLERECPMGTWVISYNFSLATKKPLIAFHERWRNCYVYRF